MTKISSLREDDDLVWSHSVTETSLPSLSTPLRNISLIESVVEEGDEVEENVEQKGNSLSVIMLSDF